MEKRAAMIDKVLCAAAAAAARFSTSFVSVVRSVRGVISLIFTTLLIAFEMGGVKEEAK